MQKSPEPRSYMVKTDQSLQRRNRRHLVETPTPAVKLEKEKRDGLSKCESSSNFTATRSGRTVIPDKTIKPLKKGLGHRKTLKRKVRKPDRDFSIDFSFALIYIYIYFASWNIETDFIGFFSNVNEFLRII